MTANKDLKRLIRKRSARTGESYTAARRSVVAKSRDGRATTHDLWFSRATQGYSGKGAKPCGFEHHVVTVSSRGVAVRTEVAFSNYGVHAFAIDSDGPGRRSRFDYGSGRTIVLAAAKGEEWAGTAEHEGAVTPFSVAAGGRDMLPSVVARFLPMTLPRREGELVSYIPVPEDAFPAWQSPGKGSWFPVMGASRVSLVERRTIVGRGEQQRGSGKRAITAFRYDHVGADGTVHATTWVDGDQVVAYEQIGCVLVAVPADDARALDPRS